MSADVHLVLNRGIFVQITCIYMYMYIIFNATSVAMIKTVESYT